MLEEERRGCGLSPGALGHGDTAATATATATAATAASDAAGAASEVASVAAAAGGLDLAQLSAVAPDSMSALVDLALAQPVLLPLVLVYLTATPGVCRCTHPACFVPSATRGSGVPRRTL